MPTHPPKVFVSYAHDNSEHRDQVLAFASFLRRQGIAAALDTWADDQRRDWSSWAIREMTDADYVIVIASPGYRSAGDGCGPPGLHRGVQSEAAILRDRVHGDRERWLPKILPVVLPGHEIDEIPLFLQPTTATYYLVPTVTVAGAAELLRAILRQPEHIPPPVATPPVLLVAASPAAWGGFDQLPAQVQGLLRAQEIVAADLPYRLRGARSQSLSTVYVRQELGTGTDAPLPEQPRTEPYRDGKIPVSLPEPPTVRLVVRPPARPIRAALDADPHLLITGGPGQGKSTLSLRLTADIVAAWESAPDTAPLAEPVVPLRLTARELASRLDLSFERALADSIGAEYGALLTGEVGADLLARQVSGRRWLLLVDGLDEVASVEQRDRLVRVLAAKSNSPYRVLLTTRPIEGAALAPFQEARAARYELQPFDETALRDFAGNWFTAEGPDTADRFVRQLRKAHLDELVRVPLLATIAAIIFTENHDIPLPDNQYELYEAYLDFLRSGRPTTWSPFEPLRIPLLEHLGRIRLETDAPLMHEARLWYSDRVPSADRPPTWHDDLATFLTAVGPLAMRGDELRFLHHSFAEHLAATSMARDLPTELSEDHPAFAHLLYTSREETRGRYPRTVLLHYTRLRPAQADRLIRFLHTGIPVDHLLVARLLAKHAPVGTAVVGEFLATARSWAMTTQYPSGEILREVTRAAHHPGLAPWLAELTNDDEAPWMSRTIAASALASRLDDSHAEEAADLLEAAVHNVKLTVADRLSAAEGLVDCGLGRRAAAENGLRLLLDDPSTPAEDRRTAAVVLAGIGPDAHAHAVNSLLVTLDDPWTPAKTLVEAATALAEIGLEFHDRCASIFRSMLDKTQVWTVIRDAARGLAALGPGYVTEAADALIVFAGNRTHEYFERFQAAETLRELGPLFGVTAGDLVLDLLVEPDTTHSQRSWYAYALSRLGPEYRSQTVALVRALLDCSSLHSESAPYLADALIQLGSEYHAEAKGLLRLLAEDPMFRGFNRVKVLEDLAKLGQQERSYVVRLLRVDASNLRLEVDNRIRATIGLMRLGPEFHREAERLLEEIVYRNLPEEEGIPLACMRLVNVNAQHRNLAAHTLIDVLKSTTLSADSFSSAAGFLTDLGPRRRTAASTLLTVILAEASNTSQRRIAAAGALVQLGGEYDRLAMEGLLSMLGEGAVDPMRSRDWFTFCSMGAKPRERLAEALLSQMSDGSPGPERTVELARVIARLSDDHVSAAAEALEGVLATEDAQPFPRFEAAVELVALRPELRSTAVSTIERIVDPVNVFWTLRSASSALAKLGHDTVPLIRGMLADQNIEREARELAATLLPDYDPESAAEAVAELRRQAGDEHLDDQARGDVLMLLAESGESAVGAALTFCRGVLDSETQPIPVRCHAAEQVVRLDRASWTVVVDVVRGLLGQRFATPADRLAAIQCLDKVNALGADEKQSLLVALVSSPTLGYAKRRDAVEMLSGAKRVDAQRLQLADQRAWITFRIPQAQYYGESPPLPIETECALREVLGSPEFGLKEQVAAAAELGKLSVRLMPEAAGILSVIAGRDTGAGFAALTAMAWMDGPSRTEALRRTAAMVTDESLPIRTRRLAATTLIFIDYARNPVAIDFLRVVAANEDLPGICRVEALHALRHVDGPEPIRAMRDDQRLDPAVRAEAATKLIPFTAGDRAAAASLLGRICEDSAARPALRLRVVSTLATLGSPGRKRAIEILTRMLGDDTLPATVRAKAGGELADICPTQRARVVRMLREIQTVVSALPRIRVLSKLGVLKPEEALLPLRRMAEDRTLSPAVRLRAAEEVADLRMDQCEPAALVVRELMHDELVPWHVRRKAACDLAEWSQLCREEARDMVRRIDATCNSRPGPARRPN